MNEKMGSDSSQIDKVAELAKIEAEYTQKIHKKYLGIRKRYWIIGLLAVAVAITIVLVIYRDTLKDFENFASYGPLGLFLFCLASNATVILPIGSAIAVVVAPELIEISPVAASLIGASAAAIGELSGYMAGYGGQAAIKKKGFYLRIERWMERRGFITIVFFSVFALVFDAAGLAAGAFRYPVWRFMIACWIGRFILYVSMAYAAAWGFNLIENKLIIWITIGVITAAVLTFIIIKQLKEKRAEKKATDERE
jgi:membrane protein YqaA with SNARE-associated domain